MTAFGQAAAEIGGYRVAVELRSVNHRWADLKLRLPEYLAAQESVLRRRFLDRIRRGRVDAIVRVEAPGGGESRPRLQRALLDEALEAARQLREQHGIAGQVDLATILALPGLFRVETPAPQWTDTELVELTALFDQAVGALDREREREGRHLRDELRSRAEIMQSHVAALRARAVAEPGRLRNRILERLANLAPDVALDPGRLAQEAALAADRADITEELVRLSGHLAEVARLVETSGDEPVGKSLDFLLQEVHRESNTVNSKTSELEMSRLALALKAETEKLREQVQNLE